MSDASTRLIPGSVSASHNATGSQPEPQTLPANKLIERATPKPDGLGWTDATVWPLRGDADIDVEVILTNGVRRTARASNLSQTTRDNTAWWRRADENSLHAAVAPAQPEYTGGSVSYYKVDVAHPTSGGPAYTAECNDVIEALGLNYAEGNALKAIWRIAAARQGKMKKGYTDGVYDAEKVVFFGERMLAQAKAAR